MTQGIHHITAISSNAQQTYNFYTEILGLRLVKKTVNFDAPDTYHLYFGDNDGSPGTVLTFFPFEAAGIGMRGIGQVTKIQFSIPLESIGFWINRFSTKGIHNKGIEKNFGNPSIVFFDQDGLQLELVMHDTSAQEKDIELLETTEIPTKYAIRSFFGAELSVNNVSQTADVLTKYLGYTKIETIEKVTRYCNKNSVYAQNIDLFEMRGWPEGITSAGTVHHIAFRVQDDNQERILREKILADGALDPTDVIDRKYFHSVYFREPNGILFEIATDNPGFAIDESEEDLGKSLKLPEKYESQRNYITKRLPPLVTDKDPSNTNQPSTQFEHIFIEKPQAQQTLVLFHGTGADERDLIPLAEEVAPQTHILSLRGNIVESGMLRFFKRKAPGILDKESIYIETEKLHHFLSEQNEKLGITDTEQIFLGFSNGANFITSYLFRYGDKYIDKAILLHPMMPFKPEKPPQFNNLSVLITTDKEDPYAQGGEAIQELTEALEDQNASVTVFEHNGGHSIKDSEIKQINKFTQKN